MSKCLKFSSCKETAVFPIIIIIIIITDINLLSAYPYAAVCKAESYKHTSGTGISSHLQTHNRW
jgi:hypothetical protein